VIVEGIDGAAKLAMYYVLVVLKVPVLERPSWATCRSAYQGAAKVVPDPQSPRIGVISLVDISCW
jgi:hypothetical protein